MPVTESCSLWFKRVETSQKFWAAGLRITLYSISPSETFKSAGLTSREPIPLIGPDNPPRSLVVLDSFVHRSNTTIGGLPFNSKATMHLLSRDAEKATTPGLVSSPAGEDAFESDAPSSDDAAPKQIDWDGPNDPGNPMNWSWGRKWTATILVSCFTFISPFSSTMVTPALDNIGRDLHIGPGFMQALVMSIFLLGYAQGPFVLAPLSEIYGRVHVLQYANLIYLAFNTACGFATSRNQLLAFRFLSGIGGSAPQAVS